MYGLVLFNFLISKSQRVKKKSSKVLNVCIIIARAAFHLSVFMVFFFNLKNKRETHKINYFFSSETIHRRFLSICNAIIGKKMIIKYETLSRFQWVSILCSSINKKYMQNSSFLKMLGVTTFKNLHFIHKHEFFEFAHLFSYM